MFLREEHIGMLLHTQYKNCSSHLCSEMRQPRKWTEFTGLIDDKLKDFSRECKYKDYLRKKGQ